MNSGKIITVNGPVIRATGMRDFTMREMVTVGRLSLLGEIIRLEGEDALVQVYEDTAGLTVGEPVTGSGSPLSMALGPGLMGSIFDGIGRPLARLMEKEGAFVTRGVSVPQIDPDRTWEVTPLAKVGDIVTPGAVLASVKETPLVEHRILVPAGLEGEILSLLPAGFHRASSVVAKIRDSRGKERPVPMISRWPVRTPRPAGERLLPDEPLLTGQRVIDGLFPLSKGGVAAIPGGFGTGKTVTQHQLAKWSDARIVVYIGCGERGNEMTQVLEEFPVLEDPRSGRPLMERTILIANTSNMPVAAREASIYTGITLAEYYRDMGYDVALMADSTSRWAEALREISGRLGEIPAEEGFPAYLPTRIAEFYERAGKFITLGGTRGSISIIGAVSPPGGDFTEPVTRHTKRFIRCFWALDQQLARSRHFPAISWIDSYSEYGDEVKDWYAANVDPAWASLRERTREILAEDDKIQQIIRLVGEDVLPDDQKLTALTASLLKNGYLQQGAFGPDSYCPPEKGLAILDLFLGFHEKAAGLLKRGCPLSLLKGMKELVELTHLREIPADRKEAFADLKKRLFERMETVDRERIAPGREG
ncbi:V-type ATP synthase subunit A [Aminivibrio sp.]|uniref:V-type ATP synthase subunit A n=1 Tax=Aminivibrio sp. TaxID=1872489 RepID=UPI001A486856|nr:V-type ATP synthase subunit A [Aminivibrio sp.]MBL3540047.1 V-type ATP synthase subunit A [Aminivibrio sp.]MDK2958863.1 V/A-type H+/Na+-transporting ATPase subunit [Synergistaceae bacterium]